MRYGYARVSSQKQSGERQLIALKKAGVLRPLSTTWAALVFSLLISSAPF